MNNKRNQSNQIIPIVVSALLIFTICYLSIAFYTLEIDFRNWGALQRFLFLLVSSFSVLMFTIYKSEEIKL